ncbi:MAG: hypothetical protein ABIC04_02460 [Nanoarchaeota archaeon]
MKISIVEARPTKKHLRYMALDREINRTDGYLVKKGMWEIMQRQQIVFDFFSHLEQEYDQQSSRVEVFEGGSGIGNALHQLKTGIDRPELQIRGLEKKIRTTGSTLSKEHLQSADRGSVDEMIVGPIEKYEFKQQYDFVFDFNGAVFYFPDEIVPVYKRILKPGKKAFLRFFTGSFTLNSKKDWNLLKIYTESQKKIQRLLDHNGFKIIDYDGDRFFNSDYLVEH